MTKTNEHEYVDTYAEKRIIVTNTTWIIHHLTFLTHARMI